MSRLASRHMWAIQQDRIDVRDQVPISNTTVTERQTSEDPELQPKARYCSSETQLESL
jgi:hypothetical protein